MKSSKYATKTGETFGFQAYYNYYNKYDQKYFDELSENEINNLQNLIDEDKVRLLEMPLKQLISYKKTGKLDATSVCPCCNSHHKGSFWHKDGEIICTNCHKVYLKKELNNAQSI